MHLLCCLSPSTNLQILAFPHAATIAINQSGAAKEYFSHTKDPVGADVGSRRVFVNYANVGEYPGFGMPCC